MLLKRVNGQWYTCRVVNSGLPVSIHTQSHHIPFQECWFIHVIHKLPDVTPNMSAANLKWHINLYFNPVSLPVSTFQSLTLLSPPLLPLPAAPANTLVSLLLMKATVLAKSSFYFIFSPGYVCYCDVYRSESGKCCTLPFLTFFIKLKRVCQLQRRNCGEYAYASP